jgi:hypothetical protein
MIHGIESEDHRRQIIRKRAFNGAFRKLREFDPGTLAVPQLGNTD